MSKLKEFEKVVLKQIESFEALHESKHQEEMKASLKTMYISNKCRI